MPSFDIRENLGKVVLAVKYPMSNRYVTAKNGTALIGRISVRSPR